MNTAKTPGGSGIRKRIVWAVDPFGESASLARRTARAVRTLAAQWDAEVEPVYLPESFLPDALPLSQHQLDVLLKGIKIPGLRPLTVLAAGGPELGKRIRTLLAHARQAQADVIAVGTRARSGLSRWLMGSFAEALVLDSDVPLYVVNPSEAGPAPIRDIFFLTDFSAESRKAFEKVVRVARATGAALTLFHKVRCDVTPRLETAVGAYPAYRHLFEEEVRARKAEAEVWASDAEAAGVRTETIVDFKLAGSVASAVLGRRGARGGMIALASRSGPFKTALLGSVTRQILRSAECPVWVIHEESRRAADEASFGFDESDLLADLLEHGAGGARR